MCTFIQGGMEDVGHHAGATAYRLAPLLIPTLVAMGVAFFRGWIADPASLAHGPEAWKIFLAARKPCCSTALHSSLAYSPSGEWAPESNPTHMHTHTRARDVSRV